ncbi:hypothetical protein GW17_00018739 [Ensete ventricosum]|nr:hypothetical protein GW17_00018739 [Ensete ventricosum]
MTPTRATGGPIYLGGCYLDAPMTLEASLKEVAKETKEKSKRSVQWRFDVEESKGAEDADNGEGVDNIKSIVVVVRGSDPVPAKKMGAGISSTSRLLRAAMPLSRHGPSKEKLDAGEAAERSKSRAEASHGGREIIAYDDLF